MTVICPKCGCSNHSEDLFCANCRAPLGNTEYRPLKKEGKKRRILRVLLTCLLLLLVLSASLAIAFHHIVEKKCREATVTIFEHGKSLDFSDIDSSYLPEALKENPNLRSLMEESIKEYLKESPLSNYLPIDDISLEGLCDEITKGASYDIIDIKTDFNRCQVTVTTENTDFKEVPSTFYEMLMADASDQESELWQTIKSAISSFFGKEEGEEQESIDWGTVLADYYDKARESAPKLTRTGTIVYGFERNHIRDWTIISFDRDLLRGFYGMDIPDSAFDSFLSSQAK